MKHSIAKKWEKKSEDAMKQFLMCTKIEDKACFNLTLDFMYVRRAEYVPILSCLKPLGSEYF